VGEERIKDQEIINILASNLQRFRVEKKCSQEELSYNAGVAQSQVARIEVGKINPTISTVAALAKGLGIDAYELLKP